MSDHARDTSLMRQAASYVEGAAQDIDGVQKTLQGEISALIGGGWKGEAAHQFLVSFQEYDREFAKVQNALNVFQNNLSQSEVQYSRNEVEQSQSAQSMRNIINSHS